MITFYNAGAGSGKTHTLSNELAKFLIDKDGHPSEIILTTFSKKSAEELKERVRKTLLEKGHPNKAAEMSNALIGTVNAVCSKLVEKYAMEADFSPQLRVLDESSMKVFFNEFVNTTTAEIAFEELQKCCNRFSVFEGKEGSSFGKDNMKPDWPNMVKNLAIRFRAYNFNKCAVDQSKKEAIKCAEEFLNTEEDNTVDKIWSKIEHSLNFEFAGKLAKKDEDAIAGLNKLRGFIKNKELATWADYAKTGKEIANKTIENNDWFAQLVLQCNDYHQSPEFKNEYCAFIGLLYDTAFILIEGYQNYKKDRGLIDFADQELLFLDMIQNNAVVKREIKATFKLVMVDEFQDSNPVQLAIFYTLKGMIENTVWVGDPKQAIYGFRDSDSELFKWALEEVKKDNPDNIKTLDHSYRSRPGIVHAVNNIFTGIFTGLLLPEHITLKPSDIVAKIDAKTNGYNHPALHAHFYEDTLNEKYFAAIGASIKDLLKPNTQVYDKKIESFRNIRGGDIALLFRTNTAVKQTAAEFKKQGIPVSCEADGLQQQAEVLWISCLLRLLINPKDELAVANIAMLENSVEGVEALITARLSFLDNAGQNKIDENTKQWKTISPTATIILAQQQLLAQMPIVQAISHLVTASELPRFCTQWGNEAQRMSNINKVIELSATYEEQCAVMGLSATFTGFILHLKNDQLLPPSDNEDAIVLMTVHKAKGLEWPMVMPVKLDAADEDCKILFNTIHVRQPLSPDPCNLLSGQTIVYLPWPFGTGESITKVSDKLDEKRIELDTKLFASTRFYQEEDRLLYVALTRARDYLVLPYNKKMSGCCLEHDKRSKPSNLFTTEHWNQLKAIAKTGPQQVVVNTHNIMVKNFEKYVAADSTPTIIEEVSFYNTGAVLPSSDEKKNRFVSPSQIQNCTNALPIKQLDFDQPYLQLNNSSPDLYAVIGTTIHNAFAAWKPTYSPATRIQAISNLIQRMQLNNHINAQELDKRFEGFWNYIQIKYAPINIIRELPLTQVTTDNGIITNGIADLILETKEGLILIDHKTFAGSFESKALQSEHEHYAGKYSAQLNMYKQMLEKATDDKVISMLVHYVVQGKMVEVF